MGKEIMNKGRESKLLNKLNESIEKIELSESPGNVKFAEQHRKVTRYWISELEKLNPNKTDETLQDPIIGYKQIAHTY